MDYMRGKASVWALDEAGVVWVAKEVFAELVGLLASMVVWFLNLPPSALNPSVLIFSFNIPYLLPTKSSQEGLGWVFERNLGEI